MSLKEKSARNLASKSTKLFADLPAMPATLIETDGALEWNASLQEFWGKFKQALSENFGEGDSRTTTIKSQLTTQIASISATITTEYATKVYADGAAEASKTEAISASATYTDGQISSVNANITTNYATKVYADGAAEASKTEAISAAATYTDGEISDLSASISTTYATKVYADGTAEARKTEAISAAATYTNGQISSLSATITSDYATKVYADGAASSAYTTAVAAAAADATSKVSIEASARAAADGNLEGKYTLTVAAGNVVTGMNITSASGPGTTISEVTFQTDRFKIYNGTLGLAPFQIVGSKIRLTGDVEIDGALLLSGTLSLTNLADRSLANLDSTANTKLAGIASGADVTLSAINGGLNVTGGGITLDAGGAIKGGASNFSTGKGFFLGYEGGQYKFRVGDPAGARIEWDGSTWTVVSFPVTVAEAEPPLLSNPGAYDITFNPPAGAPAGYWVQYKQGSGSLSGPLTGFPFTLNMASGTERVLIWSGAPGYTQSGITDTSWNELFV